MCFLKKKNDQLCKAWWFHGEDSRIWDDCFTQSKATSPGQGALANWESV